jgi:hypothetical protein
MGLRGLPEFQLPSVFSKCRPDVADAIFGHMTGRAKLGNEGSCASMFVLLERIFCIDGVALTSLVQASGLVPAWLRGGAALEVLFAGGKQGSDCFSAIFFRVCSAIVRGLFVIFSFLPVISPAA